MLYVTNRAVYFYSPFNEKTLIGYGTKIKIEFEQIADMKKETSMIIFHNSLKFVHMDASEITFTSFVSRDSCFLLI